MYTEKIRAFLLQNKGQLIGLSKDSTQEFIDDVNYLLDKGYLNPNGNCYIFSAKATDFLNEMDKKDIEIRILEHLKEQNAKSKKIDIAAPFLIYDDSFDTRLTIVKALEYLQREKFIELDGYPHSLCSKMAGQFSSKYTTGLKASITKLGEKEIEPKAIIVGQPHQVISNTYNLHGSISPVIGDNNQSSVIADSIITTPTTTNTIPKKSSIAKKIFIGVIIAVIGGLIVAVVMWYFHFNSVRP